jgi:hypothetical protein
LRVGAALALGLRQAEDARCKPGFGFRQGGDQKLLRIQRHRPAKSSLGNRLQQHGRDLDPRHGRLVLQQFQQEAERRH